MIDVSGGYMGNPAVETAGFKMKDASLVSILSTNHLADEEVSYLMAFFTQKQNIVSEN